MVVIGQIGALYGLKGFVHVTSFTEQPENILRYKTWYLGTADHWQKVTVLESRAHGKKFVALLEGYQDCTAASLLRNQKIAVPREELPPLEAGKFYWEDLVGLTVITESGVVLGKVESLLETGANDVIIVRGETKEHLIPYVPEEFVLDINLETGIMRVAWDPEF